MESLKHGPCPQVSFDETVVGTQIGGTQDITTHAGRDITVKGSSVSSEKGKVDVKGDSVTISGETEYHERLHEEHREKVGFLSSTKTDIYDRQTLEGVVGSNISGSSAAITATGKDITISGSDVVADNDVNLKAQGNVNITSQEETSSSDYQKQVKKSGLLSGGGLGFTIGKEKQKDTYANQNTEYAGSTIGSVAGNVTIEAGKDVSIAASDVIGGQDISLTGENVTVESRDNTYNAQEKHEYKKSGLTVAFGGKTVEAVGKVVAPLERATQVKDERLAALYGYKAYDELTDKETKKDLEGIKDPKNNISIEVSIGSQKSESKAQSSTTLAQESNILAQGDVTIQATKEDINIHGSNVSGENVSLQAKENINITASDNTNTTDQTTKSSSGSIGVSISVEGISGINAGYNKGKGEVKENSIVYNPSSVTASDTLTLESGKDTHIIGSKVSGDTVKADVGENLNIESLQAQESYDEKNSSSGLGISVDLTKGGKTGIQGSTNKGKIESDYESVTDQAGIYAGEGGFDIEVGGNTDLKGAVISSEADADKNKLSTDTLTYSDIENKAEYSASGYGLNYSSQDGEQGSGIANGFTPSLTPTVKGDADSVTHSAISPGTIVVGGVKVDPNISRDPQTAVNALGKIFDKKTVQEKQELASLFGQMAYEAVGKISRKHQEEAYDKLIEAAKTTDKKEEARLTQEAKDILSQWGQGGTNKIALHALVGGLMSGLSGNGFGTGALSGGLNEALQKGLGKWEKDNPAANQWASLIIGAAVDGMAGGNSNVGANAALSGTKYNWDHTGHNFILDSLNYPQEQAEEMRNINKTHDEKTQSDNIAHAMGVRPEKEYIDVAVALFLNAGLYSSYEGAVEAGRQNYARDNEQRRVDIRDRVTGHLNAAIECKNRNDSEGALYNLTIAAHLVADDRAHRQAGADIIKHAIPNIVTIGDNTYITPAVDNKFNLSNEELFKDSVRAVQKLNGMYQSGIPDYKELDELFPQVYQ